MQNIAVLLRNEMVRSARMELRRELAATGKALAVQRRTIAALKMRTVVVERHQRNEGAAAKPAKADQARRNGARFSAKGLKSHRTRLGLSAEAFGKLLGVGGQSIYNWEGRRTVPPARQTAKIASIRNVGKRGVAG